MDKNKKVSAPHNYMFDLFLSIEPARGWIVVVGNFYYGLSPIPLKDYRITVLSNPLASCSAKFFTDLTNSNVITFSFIFYQINLCLTFINLFILVSTFSWVHLSIVDLQLQ